MSFSAIKIPKYRGVSSAERLLKALFLLKSLVSDMIKKIVLKT